MDRSELYGIYDSGYAMTEEGETVVVTDCITFAAGVEPGEIIGTGQVDEEGYMMMLNLRVEEYRLIGTWEERDPDDQIVYGGDIELGLDDDGKLAGIWSMRPPGGSESDAAYGTWNLAKRLGSKALSG
jgi:hypothetical protein